MFRDLPGRILWDGGDPWSTKGPREAGRTSRTTSSKQRGMVSPTCTKVSRPGRRPAGLSREILTGRKCKEGVHGGVSGDDQPTRNSTTMPKHASTKLDKSKLSWN